MVEIISIRFKEGGKQYYFNPNGELFRLGEGVIVETARGVEFGECTQENTEVDEMELTAPLRPVLRRATPEDQLTREKNKEKEARAAALQEALQGCTKTPFEMMELSLEALRLTDGLVDRSNASAASDLGCAALHLGSAVQGAWLNVLINLGSVRDAAFAAQYRTRGQMLDEALPLAQSIYDRVLKAVQG